ncbi:MAG: hypothetical protein Alis3KO_26260 [Aliiglaciecola sp.]
MNDLKIDQRLVGASAYIFNCLSINRVILMAAERSKNTDLGCIINDLSNIILDIEYCSEQLADLRDSEGKFVSFKKLFDTHSYLVSVKTRYERILDEHMASPNQMSDDYAECANAINGSHDLINIAMNQFDDFMVNPISKAA